MAETDFFDGVQWRYFTSNYFNDLSPNDNRDRTRALSAIICEVDKAQYRGAESLSLAKIRRALIDGWTDSYNPEETPTDGTAN